ncbi:PREDICTED: serine/threonine-protein phosphatase 6 regulatory ankyrin repeat subunit B-like isoform X2 [Amphimedon queenslandica]|uniref:Ion transport domain-containing protein n=1 Tax=Amphimedon queenslandica TaxID=400682 RepID=A0AAN0JLZ8_AMPQE|nr:PREDICTED: serine/threonine-protein phosphatase 6 regulatory ankyrin repeat subunit B-like isoform X2 [Amphimedon queenslandica]|eukprot:XP_019858025.1 PREDICTED: serine/threonine-protein phosphatase 6 regulatory ankyrin repeat subunit B-like isoform X2 [Amphimedon queenslandica]
MNSDYDKVAELLQKGGVNIIATDKNKSTPLHLACTAGNERIVDLLIKKSADSLAPASQRSFINLTDGHENTPLGIACYKGHTQVAELLLNHGADINHTNSQQRTPLGVACIEGHTEIVKLLLNHGADINAIDINQNTPLGNASIPGHMEIVKLLLKHGADINHTDKDHDTMIGIACIGGHTEIVKLLLEHGGADINHVNKYKRTPLIMTCIEGHTEIIELLLKHGANLSATDSHNDTALGVACIKGFTQVVELLLKQGADVKHTNKYKRTPLVMTCIEGHMQIIELLLEYGSEVNVTDDDNDTPLGVACMKGFAQVVELLLKHGADITHANKHKRTPLVMACLEGHTGIVEVLLKHGADINVTDKHKRTPLGMTCIEGHEQIVDLLLKHGAKTDVTDNNGNTPLGNASIPGHTKVVELLLKHGGADINHKNKQERTPLSVACIEGHTEVVQLLLEHKADVNVTDNNRNTPLGNASIPGHAEIVKLLLQRGVTDMNHKNKNDRTPLGMACMEGHPQVVELLLKHGADISVTDDNKNTPLGNASEPGHTQIVELILKHGGAAIDHKNRDKCTPLVMACMEGHTKVVELLLKHGANINATDDSHDTPLGIACKKGFTQIVELLLKHDGADNNANTKNQRTVEQHGKAKINHTNANKQTPLGIACEEGHTQIVEMLLEHGEANINHPDKEKNTPLGIAYNKGHIKLVELLLKYKADVNVTDKDDNTILYNACKVGRVQVIELFLAQDDADFTKCDKKGLNPLDIAVEKGHKDAAMAIVKSDKHWEQALRNLTALDESDDIGIQRIWCCKRKRSSSVASDKRDDVSNKSNDSSDDSDDSSDSDATSVSNDISINIKNVLRDEVVNKSETKFTTPLRRIINKMPDVAKVIFERCCKTKAPQDHPNHEITFNYEFLDDFDQEWSKRSKYSSQNHCLNILANSQSADLLQHPLATALLNKKWRKIGRKFYYSNLTVYFLFVILLTSFALALHSPNSPTCMEVFGNDTNTFIDCSPDDNPVHQRYISFASVCLIIYSAIMILREVFQMIQFRLQYFTSSVNFFEILLFILTIMFASVRSSECYCTRPWQWQVGVIAVFLSWIALIFSIRKLPIVGIYVVMFIKIFNNFVKVVLLALLLIFAFAVPFYMMFYDPQDGIVGIRTPFITPWRTIMKTVIMTEGEYDMDSILRQNNQMSSPDIQYPVVAFSLIVVFVVLMPILFLNLLTGLAVGDTQEIQKSADTYRLVLRVEFTLPIEEFLRSLLQSPRLPKRVKRSLDSWKKSLIKPMEARKPNQQSFFKQKIDEIVNSVSIDQETVADVKNQLSEEIKELRLEVRCSVSQEVKDLRSSMDQLLTIVKSMKNEKQGGKGGGAGEVREPEKEGQQQK